MKLKVQKKEEEIPKIELYKSIIELQEKLGDNKIGISSNKKIKS